MSEQPTERPVKELDDHPHPEGDREFAADETLGDIELVGATDDDEDEPAPMDFVDLEIEE